MKGLLTRDERAVIAFLTVVLAVGSIVLGVRKVNPALLPDLGPSGVEPGSAASRNEVTPDAPRGPVAINTATVDELVALPGIGPVKAAAIVEHRDREGPFESLEALVEVRGIGPATLESIRSEVVLSSPDASTEGEEREER